MERASHTIEQPEVQGCAYAHAYWAGICNMSQQWLCVRGSELRQAKTIEGEELLLAVIVRRYICTGTGMHAQMCLDTQVH